MILYYSRTRKTEVVAKALHTLTGLPLHALTSDIDGARGLSFIWKAMRGAMGAKGNPVGNIPADLPKEIYLCGPIWAGEAAGPLKYFIANADLRRTKVHAVLTARMPTAQYQKVPGKLLERVGATPGEVFLLATAKELPESDVVMEHLREWLSGFAPVEGP